LVESKKPRAPACHPIRIDLDEHDRRLGWRVGGFEGLRSTQSLLHIAGDIERPTLVQSERKGMKMVVIGGHGRSNLVAESRDAGRQWQRSSVPSTRFGGVRMDNSDNRDSAEGTR
jgi:hypothetical protein